MNKASAKAQFCKAHPDIPLGLSATKIYRGPHVIDITEVDLSVKNVVEIDTPLIE